MLSRILKRKRLLKILILNFLFFQTLFSSVLSDETQEVYLQIRAENLVNDFFMVRYDYNTDEVYLGLNSFFYFLEIYGVDINLEKKSVKGRIGQKEMEVSFSDDEAFVFEDELYVSSEALKEKLGFEQIQCDMSMLTVDVKAGFMLPYQEREKGRVERLRLEQQKDSKTGQNYNVKMEKKLIRPGLIRFNYNIDDLTEKDDSLSFEYGTQFLWGELSLYGSLRPKKEISSGKLTYSNIFLGNNLVFGNIDSVYPSFVNLDSNIIGVSFDDYSTYSRTSNGETVIKGEADNADSIELYRNGMLIDYLTPTGRNFEFHVSDVLNSAEYIIKIYYKDGRIEERTVYSLDDMDALKKGVHKPILQIGKTQRYGREQLILKDYYGVSENLTLGAGYLKLNETDGRNTEILESNIIYNTRLQNFPTLINLTNYLEVNQNENSYNFDLTQRIYDINIRFNRDRYSEYFYKSSGTKEYTSISGSKSFDSLGFEFGVNERENYYDEEKVSGFIKTKNLYGNIYFSFFSPFNISLYGEKSIYGHQKYKRFSPSVSLNRWASIILNGDFTRYDENKSNDIDKYSLEINKRDIEVLPNLYLDLGVEMNYSKKRDEDKEITYGITFTLDMDDIFDIRFNSDTEIDAENKRKTTNGVSLTKFVDVANPLKTFDNTTPVNSYLVEGRVFLDKNSDGVYNSGDVPLEGVEVLLDGRKFKSDKNGKYIADGIGNNEIVTLDVERKSMDPMMKNTNGAIKIKTSNSSVIKVDIPVEVVSMITGNIWKSGKMSEREFIQNISMTTIRLEKNGKVYKEIDPEFDGMFFFEDIPPGEYNLKFIYLGQEPVEFSPNELPISVKLKNPDEGEYFEGNDVIMNVLELPEKETSRDKIENSDDSFDNLENILNNY